MNETFAYSLSFEQIKKIVLEESSHWRNPVFYQNYVKLCHQAKIEPVSLQDLWNKSFEKFNVPKDLIPPLP